MIILEAPYENILTSIFLPSPTFGDTLSLGLAVNEKISINNTRYTYVKRKGRKKLNYTLELTINKSFELQAFVDVYLTDYLKLTDHKGQVWRMKFVSDPFSYTYKTRDERTEILLALEGTLINAASINC